MARHGTLQLDTLQLGVLSVLLIAGALFSGCKGDAVLQDGGAAALDAGPVPPIDEGTDGDFRSCYDGIDNDNDGAFDCADPGCDPSRAILCCIGSGSAGCCAGPVLAEWASGGCADGPASDCAILLEGGHTLFGTSPPVIESGALVPQGGAGYGGLTLGQPLDPRAARIALTATLSVPALGCEDCIDAAGIALIDRIPEPDGPVTVRLGVLAVGGRDELLVFLDGETIATEVLSAAGGEIELGTTPDGDAYYQLPGRPRVSIGPIVLPESVVPVVYGRTENRSAGEGALSINTAKLEVSTCDVPSAVVRRTRPVFPSETSSYTPGFSIGRPSAVRVDSATWVALPVDGTIHILGANGIGELIGPAGAADPGARALELPSGIRGTDPWLEMGSDALEVLYVEEDEMGVTSIHRATGVVTPSVSFRRDPVAVISASDLGVARIGAPTHVFFSGQNLMVVRVETDSGDRHLAVLELSSGGWGFRDGSLDGASIRTTQSDLFAFDRDDVGEPALIATSDAAGRPVLRLYYVGARGTRRAIGVMASADGQIFRPIGEVLGPSEGSFDDLSVTGPAPVLSADGSVELYYRGASGVGAHIGWARPLGTMGE